ncbi:MAG: energy-coupled thiamine transporter ThiT [Trichococcus sp.]|uniref:energy-coupled thiamine transporter ThiT n=1 Tax=Trichococcus sp. TaxID=1985464 RepID=UPI003C6A3011
MGSNSTKAWIEAALFAVLAIALAYVAMPLGEYTIVFALLPLLFVSLRRGILLGLVSGTVTGLALFMLKGEGTDVAADILTQAAPFVFVGIAGFFAKFTQRTLNNKRFPNAALNIVTASFFGTLVYFVWALISDIFLSEEAVPAGVSAFAHFLPGQALSFAATFAVSAVVLVLIAKFAPKAYIPKGSRFLSRKEKSKLLND